MVKIKYNMFLFVWEDWIVLNEILVLKKKKVENKMYMFFILFVNIELDKRIITIIFVKEYLYIFVDKILLYFNLFIVKVFMIV